MQVKETNMHNTFGKVDFNKVCYPALRKMLAKQSNAINKAVKGKDIFIRDSKGIITGAFNGVTIFIPHSDSSSSISFVSGKLPFSSQKLKDFVNSIIRMATSFS